MDEFEKEMVERIDAISSNQELRGTANAFMRASIGSKYSYNFTWLGRPIIQYPQDVIAMQELVWQVRPDLIIETGIAHGGSIILSASLLSQLDMCDAIESSTTFDPKRSNRKVLGIDIDIRAHNRAAIEMHPMASRIQMIQGSSIARDVIAQVQAIAANFSRVLICLDSNHTHEHVLAELQAYAHLTSIGSYCVVFDTVIEDLPAHMCSDRPWGPGNNAKTATREFLISHSEFEIDKNIQSKLLITVAPDGYLKRVR